MVGIKTTTSKGNIFLSPFIYTESAGKASCPGRKEFG